MLLRTPVITFRFVPGLASNISLLGLLALYEQWNAGPLSALTASTNYPLALAASTRLAIIRVLHSAKAKAHIVSVPCIYVILLTKLTGRGVAALTLQLAACGFR